LRRSLAFKVGTNGCGEEKKERKQVLKSHSTLVNIDAEDMLDTILSEAKAKHLGTAVQRSSANRLHAS